jgi:hypothetical protein
MRKSFVAPRLTEQASLASLTLSRPPAALLSGQG